MTEGIYHSLSCIYLRLNEQYFANQITAFVTWGKWGKRSPRFSSIRLGSYDATKKLITIHPALDQASVPRLCVERIVYHEMLHQKHPILKGKRGRRLIHTPSFRQDEKKFTGATLADQWFEQNIKNIFLKLMS